jgi:serine protease AprX
MEKRYKIRFRSREALQAALAIESVDIVPRIVNTHRAYITLQPGVAVMAETVDDPGARVGHTQRAAENMAREFDAEVVVDHQYDLEQISPHVLVEAAPEAVEASLGDVVKMNKAEQAWATARGENVTIAIVDTGIHGGHLEFAPAKRDGGWAVPGDDPWTDYQGHGTMCACIAAGTSAHGGKFDGVAPDAKIMSCKTHFLDSELAAIYDALTARAQQGARIVASNSFGIQTGSAPTPDPSSDFLPALDDAVAAGVVVAFSAGNYHALAGGGPSACSPTSIWLHKSRADVLTVATCRLDGTMWDYSSRGPSQDFGSSNTSAKPDVTAPTPANGRILYGAGERVLANGWGTSGACPQVAGLAALLISANPGINRTDVFKKIRNSAQTLGFAAECEGKGLINCAAAFAVA